MTFSKTIGLFARIWAHLTVRHKKGFFVILSGAFIVAAVETGCLGVIALFVATLADPDAVVGSSSYEQFSHVLGGFSLRGEDLILFLAVFIVFAVVVKNVALGLYRYACTRYSGSISIYFSVLRLSGIMRMPYPWVLGKNKADLITEMGWTRSSGIFVDQILQLIIDAALVCILFTTLMVINPALVGASLAVVGGLAVVILYAVRKKIDFVSKRLLEVRRQFFRDQYKATHGLREARILGKELECIEEYANAAYQVPVNTSLIRVLQALPGWMLEVVGFSIMGAVAWTMFFWSDLPSSKVISLLGIISLAAWRAVPAIIRMLSQLTGLRDKIPQLEDTLAFLDKASEVSIMPSSFDGGGDAIPFTHTLAFDNVGFRYSEGDDWVLRDISFAIRPGEFVGIIGRSGAGKTSLADLLIGLQVPSAGKISVDGLEFGSAERISWIRQVGCVSQKPFLFDGSLAQNVAFTTKDSIIDKERVLACCRKAAVDDFLSSLPNGIDSHVGDQGLRLSGGQQQRICIARSLYSDPKVLLFDEATSSLDGHNEKIIRELLTGFRGIITMVAIAHRLSTVRECDRIIWLEKGRVKMVGPPGEVLPLYEAADQPPESSPVSTE